MQKSSLTRRRFLSKSALRTAGAGLLMPAWKAVADYGELNRAYADEIISIEEFSKGQYKPGDIIDANNVEGVRDLLDPIRYQEIVQQGRKLELVPTTLKIEDLSPVEYIQATLSNRGRARFDSTGNVVNDDGGPWIGGNPFPEPKDATEVFAGITMTWGRHDVSMNAIKEYDLDQSGIVKHRYEIFWVEYAPTGRVSVDPKPHVPGHEDKIRYNTVLFTAPSDFKGTSFLNIWPYDQREYPDLRGYLPQFKRVRKFPAGQRFEPLIPGSNLYLSDVWTAGDPFLTWGNYKIVGRGPMLGAGSQNWVSSHPNWERGTHGGPEGNTFWDMKVELVPDTIIVEAEPVGYPRAPISKKRVWFDTRTLLPVVMVTYDRKGNVFKSFDGAASMYKNGDDVVMDGKHPYWSWCCVHAHNIQNDHMSRFEQVKEVAGGYKTSVNQTGVYDEFLTVSALRRLGT